MHTKLTNGKAVRYSIAQLRRDNPQVSFPQDIPPATLAEFGVYPLQPTEPPVYDPLVQDLAAGTPVLQAGEWVQTWIITDTTAEEIAQRQAAQAEQIRQQRAQGYREESDFVFFKTQRGEATHQEWLDKVAEIKARFPA